MHSDSVVAKIFSVKLTIWMWQQNVVLSTTFSPLRLFVLRDLPLGHDADYEAISFGPVNRHGNIICDHSQTSVTDISGQRAYGVYARRAGGRI